MSTQSRTELLGQNPIEYGKSSVHPLLTDLYEITMAYGFWKSGKTLDHAIFDLFFRTNPFKGEFTIFAGLEESLRYLENFRFSDGDIKYLKTLFPPETHEEFFEYLHQLRTDQVKIYAPPEGTVMFPRVPLLRVEGPLIITQLLETTLLNLINFPSLIATNAARFRLAAGENVELIEMGLRRSQGPDGGVTASRYSYIGGFDATSNCLAGKLFNIPCRGTQAHSYISSFKDFEDLRETKLKSKNDSSEKDLLQLARDYRKDLAGFLGFNEKQTNNGELTAFVSWAIAYPEGFFALLDTYETRFSGLFNFCAAALALYECGYKARGVRIDSGDLAYLSNVCNETFQKVGKKYNLDWFGSIKICASNNLNETTIYSLNEQKHSINVFGVGTNLVTCQAQPALGGVYKLVHLDDIPRMKITEEAHKMTMPGEKTAYRLHGKDVALMDIIMLSNEDPPKANEKILCRHPFVESKRAYVTPDKVELLHHLVFCDGKAVAPSPTGEEIKERVKTSLDTLRPDIKRTVNPTPYKVSVSEKLYKFLHEVWLTNTPIGMIE